VASIDKRPDGQFRARWRQYPGGPQRTKHFRRKADARRFLDGVRGDLARGVYIDPRSGQVSFRDYAEEWRVIQPHADGTRTSVESDLRLHIYPRLRGPMSAIRPSHVQAMVTGLDELAASTLRRVYGRVVTIFRAAVRDRIIAASPCVDIRLPRARSTAIDEVLTTDQVLVLADAVPDRYRALIIAGAGTGLRPGELFGLVVDEVGFLDRAVRVERQLVRARGRGVILAPLKTQASYRSVPLPDVVATELSAHLARYGPHAELGLVFTNERGAPIQQQPFGSMFANACRKAELPEWATPHDWRHYYASLLIRNGASVKTVQARLGHASAKTTLDTYVRLWPDEGNRTRQLVDTELGAVDSGHQPSMLDELRTS
jgi:integrase